MAPAGDGSDPPVTANARVGFEIDEDVCLATLDGEIDLSNVRKVSEQLTCSVPPKVLGLVLDLSGAQYLDSSAVSLLFEVARTLHGRRQRMVLVVPRESHLSRLFSVTKIAIAIPIALTVHDAERVIRETADEPLA